jgi:hypothetical protein
MESIDTKKVVKCFSAYSVIDLDACEKRKGIGTLARDIVSAS